MNPKLYLDSKGPAHLFMVLKLMFYSLWRVVRVVYVLGSIFQGWFILWTHLLAPYYKDLRLFKIPKWIFVNFSITACMHLTLCHYRILTSCLQSLSPLWPHAARTFLLDAYIVCTLFLQIMLFSIAKQYTHWNKHQR